MDLRGDLKTIKGAISSNSDSSSNSLTGSTIELRSDYGCKHTVDENTCSVCLEGECDTMLLPCHHQFHAECIIQWTERQFSCPMCRTEISHFVPLRHMKSKQEADFVKLWNKHYVTSSPGPSSVSPVTKEDPSMMKMQTLPSQTMKRTSSLTSLSSLEPEPGCANCNGGLINENIWFAFDKRFCTTGCRLNYARNTPRPPNGGDEGTIDFYADYSKVEKYLAPELPSGFLDMRIMK